MPNAEPTLEEMLQALVDANRDEYESKGHVVSNPERFDDSYRRRICLDEERREGSIRRAWERLTGNAPLRIAPPTKPAITQLEYTGGLAATLIASGDWTAPQIEQMLVDADGISHELARRIMAESTPEAMDEVERRRVRAATLEALQQPARLHVLAAIEPKPSPPAPPEPEPEPDADLDDDDLWNQEPA